jgi:hypothetical protein
MGARSTNKYGRFGYDGKVEQAHRFSYRLFVGEIPAGLCALHSCHRGHEGCVNPAHLRVGTMKENAIDTAMAGHQHLQKLSSTQALEIKAHLKAGLLTFRQIGELYGVGSSSISRIKRGYSWAHLTSP